MKNELQLAVINAINLYTETAAATFYKQNANRTQLINLAFTLKQIANPDSVYPADINILRSEHFLHIKEILDKPENILPNKHFTEQDKKEILALLRFKLDQIANNIIVKNKLQNELNNLPTAESWSKAKPDAEQQKLIEQYNQLRPKKQAKIRLETKKSKGGLMNSRDICYEICNHSARRNAASLNYVYKLNGERFHSTPTLPDFVGSSPTEKSRTIFKKILLVGGCGLGLITGLLPAFYMTKKMIKSLINLLADQKANRSEARFYGTWGGGAIGAFGGAAAGTAIFPGLGTIAGGFIGYIMGAFAGSVFTKYSARAISAVNHKKEINPTNPEKYQLTEPEQKNLLDKGFDLNKINNIMRAIKREKDKIGILRYLPYSQENDRNDQLNNLLFHLKNGDIKFPFSLGDEQLDPVANRPAPETKLKTTSTRYFISQTVDKNQPIDFKALQQRFAEEFQPLINKASNDAASVGPQIKQIKQSKQEEGSPTMRGPK